MKIPSINANNAKQNPQFAARIIAVDDLECARPLYDSIYDSTAKYPQSVRLILKTYSEYMLSMHSPFSSEQIKKLNNMIAKGKDVLLGRKENNAFSDMVMKIHSIKDKESYMPAVKRTEVDIAEELGIYNWLKHKIKKSTPISYMNFKMASRSISQITENRQNEIKILREKKCSQELIDAVQSKSEAMIESIRQNIV